ncbi:FkbM family methyltransferase [uncultured Methanomethylovorans sp.]|uniref:FkbM family methyltransferase n=1 Tax=uncultured Methanomethylovorans sp. TaxID=183759 RepID=UPI002AA94203|nr:FkbM family methyltransferase [uncultured Methanomethylovorans sp.]
MIRSGLINRASKYLGNGKINYLLYGFTFFAISRTNMYSNKIFYSLAKKIKHKSTSPKVEVNGSLMYIDLNDNGISKQLYIHRKREHFSTDYIQSFLDDDEIVIDVGGNIGYYALMESRLANEGKVYVVEPIPSNFNILSKNIELNNRKNIFVFQLAMGDANTKGKMYVYDKCNLCSFTKDLNEKIIGEIEVPIITLDSFVKSYMDKKPTFIRMDAEGYEYQILKGASTILKEGGPLKLCIELHSHLMSKENMDEIITSLKQNGFKVMSIFIEPDPANYHSSETLSKLAKLLGDPEFGFVGNNYESLTKILDRRSYAPIVFFEKT